MTRIEVLDWVRALAVTLVVFCHAGGPVLPGGGVGVSIFFVLSGYLIASILMRDDTLGARAVGRFFVRRILRIYPLFALDILAAVAVIAWRHPESLDYGIERARSLLVFTGWPEIYVGFGLSVLWTLIAEFWFYVSFPFVAWLALRTRSWAGVFAVAAAVSIAAKLLQKQTLTLLYYDHFLIGATLFMLVRSNRCPEWVRNRRVAFACLAVILVLSAIPPHAARDAAWFAESLVTALATGVLIAHLLSNPPAVHLPALALLGRISYSIYFVHGLVLDAFPAIAVSFPAYAACVVAISSLTYVCVERPSIRLAHYLTRSRASVVPAPAL